MLHRIFLALLLLPAIANAAPGFAPCALPNGTATALHAFDTGSTGEPAHTYVFISRAEDTMHLMALDILTAAGQVTYPICVHQAVVTNVTETNTGVKHDTVGLFVRLHSPHVSSLVRVCCHRPSVRQISLVRL
jgi:hypothetical protein